jgi:hypothetical protein
VFSAALHEALAEGSVRRLSRTTFAAASRRTLQSVVPSGGGSSVLASTRWTSSSSRLDRGRRPERPVGVAVDRLQDSLAFPQVLELLGGDVDVVAVTVERCDAQVRALLAVIAVVVVSADVRTWSSPRIRTRPRVDGGLARHRIAHDAEDDRPEQSAPSRLHRRRVAVRGGALGLRPGTGAAECDGRLGRGYFFAASK